MYRVFYSTLGPFDRRVDLPEYGLHLGLEEERASRRSSWVGDEYLVTVASEIPGHRKCLVLHPRMYGVNAGRPG